MAARGKVRRLAHTRLISRDGGSNDKATETGCIVLIDLLGTIQNLEACGVDLYLDQQAMLLISGCKNGHGIETRSADGSTAWQRPISPCCLRFRVLSGL